MQLVERLAAQAGEMAALRRDLHAHPELCFQEHRTADVVARTLAELGIPVHRGLGTTGVVGILKNGNSGRSIGLRADMDALPIQELNTFAHASRQPGVMHACGHDGHTAMLLLAARHLAATRAFDGTVYLVFQPAEEGGGGAREMIREGLFEKFPMDAVFGMHNWPGLAAGSFAVGSGPVMASSSEFRIVVHGKGAHAALPHNGIDPIVAASHLVLALQSIVSRNVSPLEAGVVSVTTFHAGEATNAIPDRCELKGTVRTFSEPVLAGIEQRMREVAQHTCQAQGSRCEFEFTRNYPATVNHPAETQFLRETAAELVGPDRVLPQSPSMASEDFSFMLQARPGAYCFIGNGEGSHRDLGHGAGPCVLHNPSYDFNDGLLPLGASLWVRLAERWLSPVAA